MNDGPPSPRENPHLAGHEKAEQTLLQAYNSGRLPHAWLITGPPGIGKATLAFRFARFVLARGCADGASSPPPLRCLIPLRSRRAIPFSSGWRRGATPT